MKRIRYIGNLKMMIKIFPWGKVPDVLRTEVMGLAWDMAQTDTYGE